MKTYEELFEEFAEVEYDGEGALLVEGFEDALTERDKETVKIIDEMIRKLKKELKVAIDWIERVEIKYAISALTELREKIRSKLC